MPGLNRPPLRTPQIQGKSVSNSQSSVKSPKELGENVISFTDVSQYKTNLIEFFRAEEEKEKNRGNSAKKSEIKGIIKTPKKDLENKNAGDVANRKPRPSVYLRFQDQVIESPGRFLYFSLKG